MLHLRNKKYGIIIDRTFERLFYITTLLVMSRSFFDYTGFMCTAIGTLLGAWGIYLTIHSGMKCPDVISQINLIFGISALLFITTSGIFFNKFLRMKRYAVAYKLINEAFSGAHRLSDDPQKMQDFDKVLEALQEFCTKISETFTFITRQKTGVCIKVLYGDEQMNAYVNTLSRDKESQENPKRICNAGNEPKHYISENSDFKYIIDNNNNYGVKYRYFMSNYLPMMEDYRNTSANLSTLPTQSFPFIREIRRYIKWPLPYKSTISVPIVPLSDKKLNQIQLLGFLCVDSNSIRTFSSNYDVNIMRGIADGFYPIMKKISEKHLVEKPINGQK